VGRRGIFSERYLRHYANNTNKYANVEELGCWSESIWV